MKVIKFIARFIAWFLVGIIALIAMILVIIQMPFVKGKIVEIAESQVNKILKAELSIGRLEGNFFHGLALNDVMLRSAENDTIVFIPRIELAYQLLPLFRNEIFIEKVLIENPYIYLTQLSDSTWNLQHIVPPSENTDTTSSPFNMKILANSVKLNNGFIRIFAYDPQIPHTVENLFLDVAGFYSSDEQQADLKILRFFTTHPNIVLKMLSTQVKADKKQLELTNLLLQTAQNEINGKGVYNFTEREKFSVEIITLPIILDEFRVFLPENFHLNATPTLNLTADLQNDNLNLKILLQDDNQKIDLKVLASRMLAYLSDSTVLPGYNLKLNVSRVDLRYWLGNPEMNYQINGSLTADGEGFDPKTLRANIRGDFDDIVLYSNPVRRLRLQVNYREGNVDGVIDGAGNFGSLRLAPRLQQILSRNPRYQINLITRNLNFAPFLGSEYKSDINLGGDIQGSGFNLNRLNVSSNIVMKPSSMMGMQIDTLNSQIDFVRQNLIVHNLFLKTLSVYLYASGNYNLKGSSDLFLEAKIDSVNQIAALAGIEDIQTNIYLKTKLTGHPDDLSAHIDLGLGNTHYQDIVRLDSLYAVADGTLLNSKDIDIEVDIHINKFSASGIDFGNVYLQAKTDTKDFDLNLAVNSTDIQAKFKSLVQLGDAIAVTLSDLVFTYKGYGWRQASDTAYISIADTEYEVRDFYLVADSSDFRQSIYVDGKISQIDEQDLRLKVDNLDIKKLLNVLDLKQNIEGLANLDVELRGNPGAPFLTADFHVDNMVLQRFRFDTIQININLLDNKLSVNLNVKPQDLGRITGEGNIPVEVRLDSMRFNVIPQKSDTVSLNLLIDKLPLAVLNAFLPIDDVSGDVESRINVGGTLGNPDITGDLDIHDGKLKIDKYGIDYRTIQAAIQATPDAVNIDTFLIQTRNGNMTAHGNMKFASELYNADLSSSELFILFNRFNPFDHKQFNMQLSGNIDLGATADSVLFSGDITIPESYIFLPAVMALMGQFSSPNIPKPLLVLELERMNQDADSVVYRIRPAENESDSVAAPKFNFLNNLQGSLRVRIPRNTWIRNNDMRIELSGSVELLKHRDFFEIFGTIDVVRGQYNLLGKVFVIQSGAITFQGGEKLNPVLNVEASYTFRDPDRNKQDLRVLITGQLAKPQLRFTLEGQDISEGDALSYILFGVNLDALTTGQQSNLNSSLNAAGIAEMAAASLISSQLTRFLGNTLSVDYIDFTAGSSFDNASFTVGKYITNKLFVSYEQHIGTIENSDVPRYEMTLEYELFRFLFLQLTSSPITNGIDIIFKVDSNTGFKLR